MFEARKKELLDEHASLAERFILFGQSHSTHIASEQQHRLEKQEREYKSLQQEIENAESEIKRLTQLNEKHEQEYLTLTHLSKCELSEQKIKLTTEIADLKVRLATFESDRKSLERETDFQLKKQYQEQKKHIDNDWLEKWTKCDRELVGLKKELSIMETAKTKDQETIEGLRKELREKDLNEFKSVSIGKKGETLVFDYITKMFDDGELEIKDTSKLTNQGDVQIISRRFAFTIFIDAKSILSRKSLPKKDIDKFQKDISICKPHAAILVSNIKIESDTELYDKRSFFNIPVYYIGGYGEYHFDFLKRAIIDAMVCIQVSRFKQALPTSNWANTAEAQSLNLLMSKSFTHIDFLMGHTLAQEKEEKKFKQDVHTSWETLCHAYKTATEKNASLLPAQVIDPILQKYKPIRPRSRATDKKKKEAKEVKNEMKTKTEVTPKKRKR